MIVARYEGAYALALPPGTMVNHRYQVLRHLGRGDFTITYEVADKLSDRRLVLKELAPPDAARLQSGEMTLADDSVIELRLMQQFLYEAKRLKRLRLRGVAQIVDAFRWAGTAYLAVDSAEFGRSLSDLLATHGCLAPEKVKCLLEKVGRILEQVHGCGVLHLDITPSNLLIGPGDSVLLTDFGWTRDWYAEVAGEQSSFFSLGYTPAEQLTPGAWRGPPTDLYALGGIGYEMLTGTAPPLAADRLTGVRLRSISEFREDVPQNLEAALMACLSLHPSGRPQTATEFLSMLEAEQKGGDSLSLSRLDAMDAILDRLKHLRFAANECPACSGCLEDARPLRRGTCLVCRRGRVRVRDLNPGRCPICRTGVLRRVQNLPMRFCPLCKYGKLRRKGSLGRRLECPLCAAEFARPGKGVLVLDKTGTKPTESAKPGFAYSEEDFWLPLSGRSARARVCETCNAQFDEQRERWLTIVFFESDPHGVSRYRTLHEDEWARIAMRLPTDCGNAVCEACHADYYLEEDGITVLDADLDPFGIVDRWRGRKLNVEHGGWIAVGKESGRPGLVCGSCDIEFDFDGDYLRLKRCTLPPLNAHVGKALLLEDWHRLARGLPSRDEETEFLHMFEALLKEELLTGSIAWDDFGLGNRWTGPASLLAERGEKLVVQAKGNLFVTDSHLEFHSRRHKTKIPLDAVRLATFDDDLLSVRVAGAAAPLFFQITPVELTFEMASGKYEITFTAADLAQLLGDSSTSSPFDGRPYAV